MKKQQINNRNAIAYVLKNFPKISETFITSEIYRLEQAGVDLRLFVIKPPSEDIKHAVVEKIRAKRFYLPGTTSLSKSSLFQWLNLHFRDFSKGVLRQIKKHPLRTLSAAKFAFVQAVRARKGYWAFPRKVYLKEFLQAAVIANQIQKNEEIGHIHGHFAHGATTVTWMVSIMTGLKFSFTAHAKDIYLESLNPAGLLPRKMDAAEFVVTCTKANQIHLKGLSKTTVHCLYHGLNAEFASLLDSEPIGVFAEKEHLQVLAVGRLVPKKGFDILIEACRLLAERKVEFKVRIVGESGEHETKLRELIKKYSLSEKIELTGAMTQKKLFSEFHKADVFCLPCRILENGDRDGIPNVMVEAMSCGLPVISTDISGIPEIIKSGENGLLIPPEYPKALADSMESIHADGEFALRLARGGLKTIKDRFNGGVSVEKLATLFDLALRTRNGQPNMSSQKRLDELSTSNAITRS